MAFPNYQLTRFPVGTLREMFTVSWPLIAGLLSGSVMMFADRVFLANYNLASLNASANAGMAFFSMYIMPIVIGGMSEVFVGRLNGEGQKEKVGRSVWQMIWFSLMTIPFFSLGGRLLSPIFSYGSHNSSLEGDYLITSCDFGVFWTLSAALMGFYVGLGRTSFVMLVTFLANLLNVLLDYLLIFGVGPFPELGVTGAAMGTGIANLFQALLFAIGFLSFSSQKIYKTWDFAFDKPLFIESFRIGVPAGLGRFTEVIAHTIFFRLVSFSGDLQLTIVAMVQSVYVLASFSSEGLCKAVTAICSNLIGAKKVNLVGKVLKSGMLQHTLVTFSFGLAIFFTLEKVIALFIPEEEIYLLSDLNFLKTTAICLFWMGVYFWLDGLSWTIIGHLVAAGDTKFLLYTSIVMNWIAYVLPVAIGITYFGWGAEEAWMMTSFASVVFLILMFWRYFSKRWMTTALRTEKVLDSQETWI